jgi:hypothetical protein
MPNGLERLDGLFHQKAAEHFFEMVYAPVLELRIELLRRDTEKIRPLFGVREPEKRRESSRHEPVEGAEVALAKRVVKQREKPGTFLRPHGMIRLFWEFGIFMEDNP